MITGRAPSGDGPLWWVVVVVVVVVYMRQPLGTLADSACLPDWLGE